MIFNEASTAALTWSETEARESLVQLASGMSTLVLSGQANKTLRLPKKLQELNILAETSFFDLIRIMMKSDHRRDVVGYWLTMAQRSPLLVGLPEATIERFRGCEPVGQYGALAEGILLCAHSGGVAISLPTADEWKNSSVEVNYLEIRDEGDILELEATVDNLSRPEHVQEILERLKETPFARLTPDNFWVQKNSAFPFLSFGQDVEAQMAALGGAQFFTIMGRLQELNESVEEWKKIKGPAPNWRSSVTPESGTTMRDENYRKLRYFRNGAGTNTMYEWHARYGSGGRIHIVFEPADQTLEVGYIGAHLPIK